MAKLVNIGFGNLVNSDKVLAVVSPDAAPIKRLISRAKEEGTLIDATQGRRTKAVLVLEEGRILLSALADGYGFPQVSFRSAVNGREG